MLPTDEERHTLQNWSPLRKTHGGGDAVSLLGLCSASAKIPSHSSPARTYGHIQIPMLGEALDAGVQTATEG